HRRLPVVEAAIRTDGILRTRSGGDRESRSRALYLAADRFAGTSPLSSLGDGSAVVRPHPIYVCLSPLIFCFSNAECLMKALASCCCALLLVGVASSVAKGDFVTSVTIENVSSELGAPIFDRGPGYLLSDVGLDVVTGTHSII